MRIGRIILVLAMAALVGVSYSYAAGLIQGRTCEHLWRSWLVEEGTMIIDVIPEAMLVFIVVTLIALALLVLGRRYVWRWLAEVMVPDWLSFSWGARLVERYLTNNYELQRQALEHVPSWAHRIVDIGCGGAAYLDDRPRDYKLGIDASAKRLAVAKHHCDAVLQADIRCLAWDRIEADAVLCCEVLEHLEEEDGERLLGELVRYPVVVVTTPREWFEVGRNGWERHLSFWPRERMKSWGFERVGGGDVPPSDIYVYHRQPSH